MYYGEPIHYVPRRNNNCCKRYFMEICLCLWLLLVTGCLLIITFCLYKNIFLGKNICTTKHCIQSSNEILHFIDTSIDPCENFQKFACGNFQKLAFERNISSPIDLDKASLNNELIGFIATGPIYGDSPVILMQKNFFQFCLDVNTIDLNGDQVFFNLLNSLGGWPIIEKEYWRENDFDWLLAMITARKIGLPYEWFFAIKREEDYYKLTYPSHCNSPRGDFPREYLKFMLDVTVNMTGLGVAVIPEINEIFNFEQELHQICSKSVHEDTTIGGFTTLGTIKDLQEFSKIDWITFLKKIKYNNWTQDSIIAYDVSHYLLRLEGLLMRTSKRIQANYIVWKTIEYFAPYLSYPIRAMHKDYIYKLTGYRTDRFNFCLNETKKRFKYVSEIELIRKQTTLAIKNNVNEIFQLIKHEILNLTLEQSINFNNDTKNCFNNNELIGNVSVQIGAFDELFEGDVYKNYLHFHVFNFSSYNIIVMITELARSFYESSFSNHLKQNIEDLHVLKSIGFEVWFDREKKKIVIPVSFLRNFFYNPHDLSYLNFGSLGNLIGLELMKILNNTFEVGFNELLGVEAAQRAYNKWIEKYGEEELLPGLYYDPNQLLWIKSVMISCKNQNLLQGAIKIEEIDSNDVRYQDSIQFRETFHCI